MASQFVFPDVGEGIQEGKIVKWLVKEGDVVKIDQPLGEVETDKAVVEMPSPYAGTVLKLHVAAGGTIKVGEVMVTIGKPGEKIPEKPMPQKEERKEKTAAEKAGGVVGFLEEAGEKKERKAVGDGILALPSIRRLAAEKGVDLATVKGTGPRGRITKEDVLAASGTAPRTAQTHTPAETPAFKKVRKYDMYGYVDRIPLTGVRKITATHMSQSAQNTAPVTHCDDADVTALVEVREKEKAKAKEKGIKVTYLPYLVKAVIAALKEHPMLNSSIEGEEIIVKKYYNIGIAVDAGDGLLVPVIKGADQKDLYTIAKEIMDFAERAKGRKIDIADMRGGSFTITNVGAIGGTYVTPIINYPECAILGIGRMEDRAVVREGNVVVRKILPLSLTFDHRIVDGAEAARFMNDLKKYLENPEEFG